MAEIKAIFDKSAMSMQTLGEAMGYESTTARQAVCAAHGGLFHPR
jgi:hypothetical protein